MMMMMMSAPRHFALLSEAPSRLQVEKSSTLNHHCPGDAQLGASFMSQAEAGAKDKSSPRPTGALASQIRAC